MPDTLSPDFPDGLLVQQLLEGTLESSEAGILLRFLDEHPEAARNLTRQIDIDSCLREMSFTGTVQNVFCEPVTSGLDFDSLVVLEKNALALPRPSRESLPVLQNSPPVSNPQSKKQQEIKNRRPLSIFKGVALVVLMMVVAVMAVYFEFRQVPKPLSDFRAVARVDAAVDITWPENVEMLRVGQELEEERIRFEKGLLGLTLQNGVRIALEGPVDFHLNSASKTFCSRGRISASVPTKAVGFEVVTPHLTLIDRGTEFVLDVDENQAEAHTIQGRIELSRLPKDEKEQLKAGEALKFQSGVQPKRIPANPKIFLSRQSVNHLIAQTDARQSEIRKEQNAKTQTDPSLLIHFDFEDVQSTVCNRSTSGRNVIGDGVPVGPKPVRGRWNGKGALQFKNKNDTVDFFISDRLKSLTLNVSVRIDSLSRPHHVLLASRGLGVGHLIWQIAQDGSLQLMIQKKADQSARRFASTPVFSRKHWGAWYRLAVVLDAENQTITHYLDGKPVTTIPFNEELSIRIANATLGNAFWDGTVASDRSFDGRMEDFQLFNRALTTNEIEHLHNP